MMKRFSSERAPPQEGRQLKGLKRLIAPALPLRSGVQIEPQQYENEKL